MRAEDEECCEVVVTAGDAGWLAGFTRTLVEERLAACGHVVATHLLRINVDLDAVDLVGKGDKFHLDRPAWLDGEMLSQAQAPR